MTPLFLFLPFFGDVQLILHATSLDRTVECTNNCWRRAEQRVACFRTIASTLAVNRCRLAQGSCCLTLLVTRWGRRNNTDPQTGAPSVPRSAEREGISSRHDPGNSACRMNVVFATRLVNGGGGGEYGKKSNHRESAPDIFFLQILLRFCKTLLRRRENNCKKLTSSTETAVNITSDGHPRNRTKTELNCNL